MYFQNFLWQILNPHSKTNNENLSERFRNTSLAGLYIFVFWIFLTAFTIHFFLFLSNYFFEETTLRVFSPGELAVWIHFIWSDNLFFILFNDLNLFLLACLCSSASLTVTVNV